MEPPDSANGWLEVTGLHFGLLPAASVSRFGRMYDDVELDMIRNLKQDSVYCKT
jgi:hypothetical protein